jgi:ketosteroid isomerase-like protein
MPYVNISLTRGKSREYLQGVSDSVHQALVEGLGMNPDDRFQAITQHDPGDLVYPRLFRGGPRSGDFVVFTIIDGLERGDAAKRRFYRRLTALLEQGPGVRPEDVFVMMQLTPPENYSFASGASGSDIAANEARDHAATGPGTQDAYTTAEMTAAITEFFAGHDRRRLISMLRDDFVLEVPQSLPYGGTFTGPKEIDEFLARIDDGPYWESFVTDLDHVIVAEDHLIAPITITARGKANGASMTVENLWLFDVRDGNFTRAQIYADTAAARNTAG